MTPPRDPADPPGTVDPDDLGSPLTAEDEREVAALLADAVGQEPAAAPPAVTARLDDVLAGLVEDRATRRGVRTDRSEAPAGSGAAVVPLAGRRRRRLPRALLAAAAVVVGGYAVGNVLAGPLTGDDLVAGSADAGGGSSAAGESDAASESARRGRGRNLAADDALSVVPLVRRAHLAADVREVVRSFRRLPPTGEADPPPVDGGTGTSVEEIPDCPAPPVDARQRLYYVRYQGELAGLVVERRRAGRVEATVYSCRTGAVELSRSVAAP